MGKRLVACAACTAVLAVIAAVTNAQRSDVFAESRDHPAVAYSTTPASNAVTQLMDELRAGRTSLSFDANTGYLTSLLKALSIPVESQVLVYSQTSFQAKQISRANPRAIYFNDRVSVGYVRGTDLLEMTAQDPRLGAVFYSLRQSDAGPPEIVRDDGCLSCHLSWDTRGVPGTFLMTVFPRRSEDDYANGFVVDHRAPILERWGGWYVTGARVPEAMGNLELILPKMPESGPRRVPSPRSLAGAFEPRGYLTMFSDVVALMVLEHQSHAVNLITRAGWEHRVGSPHVPAAVEELADYLLFVDEAPFPHPIEGSSGFGARFAALGPKDAKGRSLRELDLRTRLMRYPLSYMIYSPGIAGLPDPVRRALRTRIDDVLNGRVQQRKYAHLTPGLRSAIQEILRETWPESQSAGVSPAAR